MSDNGRVTLTINGQKVQAEPGRVLIDVAEEMGVFVPRFCYHPGMKSVAVCRMCLVKVEGQRKLLPACATPVAQDMVVDTVDEQAVDAQQGMLEFLLINHPLDCPICDRAGECPLQDQTYRHGPGTSRYIEPKRSWEKALDISELVVLDRERCVLCWRCVRFADEIAGDQFIQLVDRGPGTQILTFKDEPFDSYFSGNTIQICPVGALTSRPYRFLSRPWDLKTAASVCAYCSVGCPITNEARSNKIVRCQALPNENVNDFWICDKGRFAYHYVDSEERLATPLRREEGEFQAVSWGQAMQTVGDKLKGAESVAVIAGGHLTTEDAYGIYKLAKKVIKTRDVDSRMQDAAAPYELALEVGPAAGSTATLNDVESAKTIVWVGPDPKETLPVLYLRLRKAVLEYDANLIVVSPRPTSLDAIAARVVRSVPGQEAQALSDVEVSGEGLVACWGPAFPGRDESGAFGAVIDLVKSRGGKLLVSPPHAGSQGMTDMGVHPGLDAGYVRVEEPGRDTRAILEAAATGDLDALLVFGADPIADFPDSALARSALEKSPFTLVFELFPTETVAHADVVLPGAAYAEREGTLTNMERRLQKLEPLVNAPGTATEAWRACQAIARSLGEDWGWRDVEDVWVDIRRSVPTHAGVDLDALSQETPPATIAHESPYQGKPSEQVLLGPGGQYPKGHRGGAPFHTGQNWPLSWELRAFEARQRPGFIPVLASEDEAARSAEAQKSDDERGTVTQPTVPRKGPGGTEAAPPESASDESPTPAADQGSEQSRRLALLTGRFIYDRGSMVSRTVALRNLARKPFVELNADDARALGLDDGSQATVSANGFDARLPVVISDIAPGVAFVPFDQEGLRANQLISGVDPSVEVKRA